MFTALTLTCTLDPLTEDAVHHLATHIAEGGSEEVVHLETMRHVNLEPLTEKLPLGNGHYKKCFL